MSRAAHHPFLRYNVNHGRILRLLLTLLYAVAGYTQGGSNADNILSDAFQKIKNTDIDWATGYEAVVKDAEEEPYDWCCEVSSATYNPSLRPPDEHGRLLKQTLIIFCTGQGRGGLDSWKRLGKLCCRNLRYCRC